MSVVDRILSGITLGNPSAILKQVPTIGGFALALAVLPFQMDIVVNVTMTLAGIGLVLLATILAAALPWRRMRAEWSLIIPCASLIAVGFFRAGTGGPLSPYVALILIPFVWIATEEGRINAVVAAVGTFLVYFMPVILTGQVEDPITLLRGFFSPVIYLIVAIVINEIAHRVRAQLTSARALASKHRELLEQSERATDQLKLNEARLRTANRLIRSIWNAVTEQSVIGTDLNGRIDVWNPGSEKMLGLTEAQVLEQQRHVIEFFLPSELEEQLRAITNGESTMAAPTEFSALVDSVRAGSADVRDWTYVRADGKHVPVQVAATPRLDENGHRVGFIFVATDMTQAREFARLKDEFVGLISHELRTPLSSILGYLELMRDDDEAPLSDEQLQYLSVAERNAHRLLRLVGDLLFTAQVESGQFPLDLQAVELPRVLEASVESARPAAATHQVTLHCEVPDDEAVVHGDPQRLGQAVDNLISNAIKFTPAGGSVTVRLRTEDGKAMVSVEDTGLGIPAVELSKLSTRFFRASTATRNAVPGVGLGLTITKAIVTAHSGHMDIESEEGVGTRFTITMPLERSAVRQLA